MRAWTHPVNNDGGQDGERGQARGASFICQVSTILGCRSEMSCPRTLPRKKKKNNNNIILIIMINPPHTHTHVWVRYGSNSWRPGFRVIHLTIEQSGVPLFGEGHTPGPVFTNHSQERSLSLSPRFANLNVTQLLIG